MLVVLKMVLNSQLHIKESVWEGYILVHSKKPFQYNIEHFTQKQKLYSKCSNVEFSKNDRSFQSVT